MSRIVQFSFDLISDLDLAPDAEFDHRGKQTSLYCIVAGNLTSSRKKLVSVLTHLGECYKNVFFLDGRLEHLDYLHDIDQSYAELEEIVDQIPNVTFLHNKMIVMEKYALLGTNLWWSHDFDTTLDYWETIVWTACDVGCTEQELENIQILAVSDSNYLETSVERLQILPEVSEIIVVTNTVPDVRLIEHDKRIAGKHIFNRMGNSFANACLKRDIENKIAYWCFGTYQGQIDTNIGNIRYLCNSASDNPYAYVPLKVTI